MVLLRVVDVPSTASIAGAIAAPARSTETPEQELTRAASEAEAYLERVAQPLRQKGIDIICLVMRGVAGEVIVAYAQNELVDLIAIATRGRSGLGRAIFGSVADFVLRESGRPILLIKPQENKE